MTQRFGSALILLGLIALVIFILTFSSGRGNPLILLLGASLSALGLLVRRRAVRTTARRARLLRWLLGRDREEDLE